LLLILVFSLDKMFILLNSYFSFDSLCSKRLFEIKSLDIDKFWLLFLF
jgi:hypothetical protein